MDFTLKMSAVVMSLQIEQVGRLHSVGFLLLKSTILSIGDGNFADNNCTENILADKFVRKV